MPRAKHKVKPGYPAEIFFHTRQALADYLSGDMVTCLLCGNEFRILDTHLRSMHGMVSDDYRERFGIPYTQGLCPTERTERDRARMLAAMESDPDLSKEKRVLADEARRYCTANGQRRKPAFWRNERTKYPMELWYEFGRRVMTGRGAYDVARDDDMPNAAAQIVHAVLKRNPEFRKWWASTVEPVRVNMRGYNLSAEGRKKRTEQTASEP